MRDIYTNAQRVIVWLGDRKICTTEIGAMESACQLLASTVKSNTKSQSSNTTLGWNGSIRPEDMKDLSTHTLSSWLSSMRDLGFPKPWSMIHLAFASDWYTRAWCLQEVYTTRNPLLLYRNTQLDSGRMSLFCVWVTMKLINNWHKMYSDASSADRRVLERILEALQRWLPRDLRRLHPASVLGATKKLQATDPRDKVYGMLALLGDIEPIQVEYRKSVMHVYIDSVLHTVAKGLHVLSHVFHPVDFQERKDWPSWLPNWNIQTDEYAGPEELCYRVIALGAPASQRQVPVIDSDMAWHRTLRIRGLLCGHITECTDVLPHKDVSLELRKSRSHNLFSQFWENTVNVK